MALGMTEAHGQEAVELPTSVGPLLVQVPRKTTRSTVAVLRKDVELITQQAIEFLYVYRA